MSINTNKHLTILKKLLPFFYIKEDKIHIRFLYSMLLMVVSIVVTVTLPIIFKYVVTVIPKQNDTLTTSILLLLLSYGLMWIFSQMLYQVRQIILLKPLARALNLISFRLFRHLHSLPIKFHLKKESGAISSIITKAQENTPNLFVAIFLYLTPSILEVCMAILIIWHYYGLVYVGVLIFIFLLSFFITFHFIDKGINYQRELNENFAYSHSHMVDSLSNFMSTKYFNNNGLEFLKYKDTLNKSEKSFIKFYTLMEMIQLIQAVVIGSGIIIVTIITGTNTVNQVHDISDFVMINSYILQFAIPLKFLGYNLQNIKKGLADLESVLTILDIQSEIKDPSNASSIRKLKNISFNKVFFTDSNESILKDINFEILKGQKIAIVGPTGSGKSTITKLLFRIYDTTQGDIIFNNINIRDIKLSDIKELISIVPQDITLFNTSIYQNILYANTSATKSQVIEVMEAAGLKKFIPKLKTEDNYTVGKSGLKLSGGERQRIAIARSMLKEAFLYVLDEATSCLDIKTEKKVLENIMQLKQKAAFLIITHRLPMIKDADLILFLKDGKIIERGNHSQLIAKNGLYFNFWNKKAKRQSLLAESDILN